jgi:DNA-nicking Smr family endonuclease
VKRKLSRDEAALWDRVAQTVAPLKSSPNVREEVAARHVDAVVASTQRRPPQKPSTPSAGPPPRDKRRVDRPLDLHTLDATWDRKLARGVVQPDFTIDLHGHTLDSAHVRLDHALSLALAQGARVVLLVTGRPRPSGDHAGRGERRGAIRAKFLDWLAAGPHASRIAAIRPAHPRHGGAGAVYLVMRRRG